MKSVGAATVLLAMTHGDLAAEDDPASRARLHELDAAVSDMLDGVMPDAPDDGPPHETREFDCSGAMPRELGRTSR